MSDTEHLIALLARPGVHSGTDLGEELGVSRVAIKKRIDRLEALGFPVESVAGRGYRIREGIEPLSLDAISAHSELDDLEIEVFQQLDSTNRYLSEQSITTGRVRACLAESQPAGQGRRGRSWVATPYRNIMLSVAYSYPSWPRNPAGISLAFSVAVHSALKNLGIENISLKWPNDLMAKNAKLGGLLVSASGEAGGELKLILGVGINLSLAKKDVESVDQAVVDLESLGYEHISRNRLGAEIIKNTAEMLHLYPQSGFEPFSKYWNKEAMYMFEDVRLIEGDNEYQGKMLGVDQEGFLQLLTADGAQHRFNNSELSLRPLNQ